MNIFVVDLAWQIQTYRQLPAAGQRVGSTASGSQFVSTSISSTYSVFLSV